MADAAQPAAKVEILREVLRRVGKVEPPERIAVEEGPMWEYRNRIQLHFDERLMGFFAAGSNDIAAIDSCAVASPRLSRAISSFRAMKRDRAWPRFVRSIELFTNESEVQVNVLDSGPKHVNRSFFEWCEEALPGALTPSLDYQTANGVFRVSHKSFFQVNRFLVDKLVEVALGDAAGEEAWDLYAGVGLFSMALSRRFQRVTAVEAVNSAAADLEHNAALNNAPIRAVRASTENFLAASAAAPEFVLADPPRAGLDKKAVDALVKLRPKRIALVSCDPSTLARDLAGLVQGGYSIESMTMVDLFPQTSHIESVTRLSL